MTDASALTATPSPLKKKKVLKVCVRRSPNTGKDELSSSSHHRLRVISRSSDDALPSLDISCHSEASVESLLQHDLGGNKNSHHQHHPQGQGGEDTASVDSSTPSLKRLAQHAAARRRTRADPSENNHQRPRRRRSRSRSRSKSRDRRTTSSSLDKINSDYNTMMKESESNIKNRKSATSTADTSISQATLQLMATSLEDAVTSATATAAPSSPSSSTSSFSTNDKVQTSGNRRASATSSSSTESSPVSLFSLEEVERQLECVSWYHRLGSPPKDIFCQRIEKATNGRLTAQDVHQLPWKKSNSFIDVAVVNARVRQAHKQKQQQRKR